MQVSSIVQFTPDGKAVQPGIVTAVLSPTSATVALLGPAILIQSIDPKTKAVSTGPELTSNTMTLATDLTKPYTFKVVSPW